MTRPYVFTRKSTEGRSPVSWDIDPRSSEEKMSEERKQKRNKTRVIISSMEDVAEARKSDKEAFEKNQIDRMGDDTDMEHNLIESRVDKGEKILDQMEKEGGIEEIKGAIEILKQVIDNAEKQKETKSDPEAINAFYEVAKDAKENIKIRESFLEYYENAEAEKNKVQNDQLVIKTVKQDNEGIISAKEKIKEIYSRKSNE